MMLFRHKLNTFGLLTISALVLISLISSSALAIAAEPLAKTKSKVLSQANVTPEEPTHGAPQWNRNRSATSREWNRAASRPKPVPPVSSTKTDMSEVPRIRHVSASGSEDGAVSTAAKSEAAPTGESVQAESEKSAPTSSLTVREQLLNALKKQREATGGARPSAIPGSLTIMNSPVAPAQHSAPSRHPAPAMQTHTEPPAVHDATSVHTPPVNAAKSHIGLTRTMEADLQSTDPYVRDRAQRYLRLEMQLLKLRANQAAAAEHPAPNTEHPAPTAEHPAPIAEHHVPESVAEHLPEPSSVDTTPADPEHHESLDEHSADHPPVHESATADPQEDAHAQSSPPLIMENVVVDGPIDRLGLANNLFATGEYPMALEMYQETAKSELTAQQHFWVEYQTANCLRRLGKSADASQRYRKLSDHPEAGWLSQQARWWVETLEKIHILEKTLADNAFDHHRTIVEEVEHAAPHVENSPAPPTTSPSPHKEATQDAHAH